MTRRLTIAALAAVMLSVAVSAQTPKPNPTAGPARGGGPAVTAAAPAADPTLALRQELQDALSMLNRALPVYQQVKSGDLQQQIAAQVIAAVRAQIEKQNPGHTMDATWKFVDLPAAPAKDEPKK